MSTKPRARKQEAAAPDSPIEWKRADPTALAAFDPASKLCTMNCGPHGRDPRNQDERMFLCDDCLSIAPARPNKPEHFSQ